VRHTQNHATAANVLGVPEEIRKERREEYNWRKVDSGDESGLRGRVISPFGRMSQHGFFVNPHKTLLHSKEIPAITVLAGFRQ